MEVGREEEKNVYLNDAIKDTIEGSKEGELLVPTRTLSGLATKEDNA